MNILIVEDDHFYAQKISEILRDEGAEVQAVGSAEEAVATDLGSQLMLR